MGPINSCRVSGLDPIYSLFMQSDIWSWCWSDCSAAVLQWRGHSAMCAQVTMVTLGARHIILSRHPHCRY